MYFRNIFLLLLLLFVTDRLFAATFTVISNADSGPGTLRQALSDAAGNGTATTDYIYFNLPGLTQADVTINLQSALPDVTANVVIDGTTQPTVAFGVSNARVIITTSVPANNFNAFNVSASVGPADAVEFYGLYITGFAPNQTGNGAAIFTRANCKLVVGAPGKGNVITNSFCGVYPFMSNAVIQSNFFGIGPDGVTASPNSLVISSTNDFDNLQFGGAGANQGNLVLAGNTGCISLGAGQTSSISKTFTIANNYFGLNYNATNVVSNPGAAAIPFIQIDDAQATANIQSNTFNANETGIAAFDGATLSVTGNYFGTNASQTLQFGNGNEAINETNGVKATIGGTTAAAQNVFTDYQNPIFAQSSITNVIQNSFYCNRLVLLNDPSGTNFVRITSIQSTSVSGDAPPGAIIQLYYTQPPTDPCQFCNPKTYFGTATANGSGKWSYNGTVTGTSILASSTVSGNTFGFQISPTIGLTEVTPVNVDCHHQGGFTFAEPRTGFVFSWTNASGTSVSSQQNPTGLPVGTYTVTMSELGGCTSVSSAQFTIIDVTPKVFGGGTTLDCQNPTAPFDPAPQLGPGFTVAEWHLTDQNGNAIPGNGQYNLSAGTYSFYIKDSNGCLSNTATYTVNPPPAAPTLNDNGVVTNAACGGNTGSVTRVTITNGAGASYGWYKVGSGPFGGAQQTELNNAPPGDYYFYVVYGVSCPQINSKTYHINAVDVVTLDESAAAAKDALCADGNGSVTGIVATNASTYTWYNSASNAVAGNTLDLSAPAGTYYLMATNAEGCSDKSQLYTINAPAALVIQQGAQVTNDQCGQNQGAIQGVNVTGGTSPYSYAWIYNSTPIPVSTSPNPTGLAAGNYTLQVTDANGCTATQNFTITNQSETITAPEVPAQQICSPGAAVLQVKGAQQGYGYRLYASATSTDVLQDNTTGIFEVNVSSATDFYVTQYQGTCESARTEVAISLGSSNLTIPNTFTPNDDGINDYWNIKGIENYPQCIIQVFNRYGQKVFESKGYSQPFDGTLGGSPLQPGVYYYVINLNSNCNLLSGSLTLIK